MRTRMKTPSVRKAYAVGRTLGSDLEPCRSQNNIFGSQIDVGELYACNKNCIWTIYQVMRIWDILIMVRKEKLHKPSIRGLHGTWFPLDFARHSLYVCKIHNKIVIVTICVDTFDHWRCEF